MLSHVNHCWRLPCQAPSPCCSRSRIPDRLLVYMDAARATGLTTALCKVWYALYVWIRKAMFVQAEGRYSSLTILRHTCNDLRFQILLLHVQQSACQASPSVAFYSLCMLAGLFLGPQMVGEALKGGRLIARVMNQEGYKVHTPSGAPACPSFITAVEVGSRDRMIAFCKAVQRASPVGSYIEPTPGKAALTPIQLHQHLLLLLHCCVLLIHCR